MRALASFDDRDPVPWANGAGQTTELVSLPDSAQLTPGLRPWRLSIARLEHVGPFSALPGMARTFLPTAEVVLEIDGHVHPVPALSPEHFHGSQNVSLVGLAEPCFAINLMVADDGAVDSGAGAGEGSASAHGELQMSIGEQFPASRFRFVLALEAGLDLPRFQLLELEPDEDAPEEVSVAVLHSESGDAHI
ncbi:HutD family protein [Brevibacterium sp. H602]|uniref:HutD family protein n=1 Tax=Brevibacterium sp. H602 TaxID=3444316 RepID=UPI003EB84667